MLPCSHTPHSGSLPYQTPLLWRGLHLSAVWRVFALLTSMLFVMLADVVQPSLAVFLVILAAVIAVGIVLRRSH